MVRVLAALLPTELLVNASGKAAADEPSAWILHHMTELDKRSLTLHLLLSL